ncbi:MAG: glycerol-3-phosphate 1-O-acyltransferase PlsY [Thermoanaerobacter sp.]|uniref:glycerol-3-phosphate 1-O-acyltransferase PlsY n=1 Tax=Thermoanaerobacter sp. TaxID=1755 RepID=UPI003463D945
MYAVLTAIIAYLIGCINNAYIFTKYTRNIDIRNYGSGNAGATNVLRVLGYKAAAPVFALDVLKGVIAVLIGKYLMGNTGAMIAGIAVVCGHNWPVFLKFRGGKGIATSIGVIMTVSPLLGLIALAIGVTVIVLTKYVSLGSITGTVTFVLLNVIFWNSTQIFIFSLILASLAIFQHRSNIKRLLAGTESKLGQKTEIK